MNIEDTATYVCAALLIAAGIYVSKKVTTRQRLRLGSILFVAGWVGTLLAVNLPDAAFLNSEVVAFAVVGTSSAAIVVSLLFLVTAFFDWLGMTRPARQRRQFPPFDS